MSPYRSDWLGSTMMILDGTVKCQTNRPSQPLHVTGMVTPGCPQHPDDLELAEARGCPTSNDWHAKPPRWRATGPVICGGNARWSICMTQRCSALFHEDRLLFPGPVHPQETKLQGRPAGCTRPSDLVCFRRRVRLEHGG